MVYSLKSNFGEENYLFSMNNLHVVGINHKSTSLELREQIMFVPNLISRAYQDIQKCDVCEVVLISTCARTECIVITEDIKAVKNWLADFHNVSTELLEQNLVHLHGAAAIEHLMRLASGIDSFVLGETQVLGQLKKAFAVAEVHGAVGPVFYKLFPSIFAVAKQIRSKTNIGGKTISLASSLAHVGQELCGDLANCRVMLIGAGEMINLVTTHLYAQGVRSWVMANRTLEKAQELANSFSGKDIVIEEIPKYLANVDIVISATASPVPLIGKGLIERVQTQRQNQPLVMADLAMPRDIEPEVKQISGVHLYHLDDLQRMIQANLSLRNSAAADADPMIKLACERFIREQNARTQVQVIRNFRNFVKDIQVEAELSAKQQLKQGLEPELVIENTLNKLVHKLSHVPTVKLRQAAMDHNYQIMQSAGFIFDLDYEKDEIT